MKDDPLAWLYGHKNIGVDLRNEGYLLKQGDKPVVIDWEHRARDWQIEFQDGVAERVPADAHRVARVDEYPPLNLLPNHAYYEPIPVGLAFTATGKTFPGNNPLWRLAAWIKLAEEIAEDWRVADRSTPGTDPRTPYSRACPMAGQTENSPPFDRSVRSSFHNRGRRP